VQQYTKVFIDSPVWRTQPTVLIIGELASETEAENVCRSLQVTRVKHFWTQTQVGKPALLHVLANEKKNLRNNNQNRVS